MNSSQAKFDHSSSLDGVEQVNLPKEGQAITELNNGLQGEGQDDTGMDFIKRFVDSLGPEEVTYLCEYAASKTRESDERLEGDYLTEDGEDNAIEEETESNNTAENNFNGSKMTDSDKNKEMPSSAKTIKSKNKEKMLDIKDFKNN